MKYKNIVFCEKCIYFICSGNQIIATNVYSFHQFYVPGFSKTEKWKCEL